MTGAYSYVIGSPPVPADVTGYVVTQQGNNVVMNWDNNADPGIIGFNVSYGEQGGAFADSQFLTEATRATEITTSKVTAGSWTFWIVAVDIAGQVSANPASFDFTVVNNNTVINQQNYVPDYSDAINSNSRFSAFASALMQRHWTGVLVPKGQFACDHYQQISSPNSSDIQLDYVSGGPFDDTTYYFETTYVTAAGETLPSAEVSIFVPAGYLPTVFIPLSAFPASSDGTVLCHGYNVYGSTASTTEVQQNSATVGFIVDTQNAGNPGDQIWQMPATGLISSGSTLPGQNTTGWDVFNTFVPDPGTSAQFYPYQDTVDTKFDANKRVWVTAELIPGPGELGTPKTVDDIFNIISCQSSKFTSSFFNPTSSDRSHLVPGVNTAIVKERWVYSYIDYTPKSGNICYLDNFQMTIDNAPVSTPLGSVSISSSGTTLNYSDYGLAYHQTPTVQVTPSGGIATGGNAVVTSSNALITLYTSTGAVTDTAAVTITGI